MSKARDLASASPAPAGVSSTELGYVDGVTSDIQTQINSKIGQSTAINPSTVTTKGDILVATGSGTVVRQGVGTDGQVLVADSAEADGVKWATPAAGGMTLLSTTTLATTSTVVSSISGSYKNLRLLIENGETSVSAYLTVKINSATSGYANIYGTIAEPNTASSGESYWQGNMYLSSGRVGSYTIDIPNYAASSFVKSCVIGGGSQWGNFPALGWGINNSVTAAITSVTIGTVAGTATLGGTLKIYGVN